jgi:exosortase
VLLGFGRRCLRAAAFPIGFLVLMAPLPRFVADAVTLHLQRFAAGFAGLALEVLGIQVYQTDTLVVLPGLTLQVGEICNGLRFLITLLTLMITFAQVSQRDLVRKILFVALTIPAAILANGVRITTIGIGAHYFGPQVALGLVHHSIAKVVWGLTLLLLLGFGLLLRRDRGRGERRDRPSKEALAAPTAETHPITRP